MVGVAPNRWEQEQGQGKKKKKEFRGVTKKPVCVACDSEEGEEKKRVPPLDQAKTRAETAGRDESSLLSQAELSVLWLVEPGQYQQQWSSEWGPEPAVKL